jgi:hypothetical protein
MKRITFDDKLRQKLCNFTKGVDICDKSGYVLARVAANGSTNDAVCVLADDELRDRLSNFSEDVEICDERGSVVALVQVCAPWSDPDQWETVEPPSAAEVQHALSSEGRRYTTEEVLDYLRKL